MEVGVFDSSSIDRIGSKCSGYPSCKDRKGRQQDKALLNQRSASELSGLVEEGIVADCTEEASKIEGSLPANCHATSSVKRNEFEIEG